MIVAITLKGSSDVTGADQSILEEETLHSFVVADHSIAMSSNS